MKKLLTPLIIVHMFIVAFYPSCKGDSWKNLQYSEISAFEWLQANVKDRSGEAVLWFQIFDQIDDKATIEGYKNSTEKVGKYPAKIFENKWIWILVNNRIEIRLIADEKMKDFQDTNKLKKFIESFDLAGMEKITGPKVKGKDLQKFIPKLKTK
ncbi:MAG: hypothetical protein KA369_07830 [Spirochaetes bacterium]|nr:hypothetical protein [Spirochaetota bacterium]